MYYIHVSIKESTNVYIAQVITIAICVSNA